ncbi:MAG: PrsW family intramembrane metalloprotease [Acidobacteria bacterium]|nr:PrsW family intramembrane metalloprotease [Acidobacteriota bacterium]
MKLQLRINSGTLAGQSYDLETGFMTIGRSETCTVRFDPQTERIASKQHCFIEAKPDGYYITDNQSTNGTFVNGQQISSQKLNSGDNIQFGSNGVTAAVTIEGASVATPAPSFREQEIQQFNEVVAQKPVSVQASLSNFGLNSVSAVKPDDPNKTKRYIGIGLAIFGVIFFTIVVCIIMFFSVGPIPAIMATFVAFIPAAIYILPLIWLDRYDPEPLWLLALAFAWGALVSVTVAFIINTGVDIAVSIGVSNEAGNIVGAVVSAPIFEEGSKGLGVILLLVFFRRYFDDILDGIVFAGVIALGFATVENVLYYGRAIGGPGGMNALIFLFVLRGIMSPFAHVTFTSMTGIGCGISRESHNMAVRIIAPIGGYFIAVFLHACWNLMATVGGLEGFVVGYVVLEIPFFLILTGFALYIMRRQRRILNEMLAMDIARGLIPSDHAATATSAFKSSFWVLGGLFNGKFRARSNYVRSIGKLGLSYWHIQRATAAQGQTASFQQNPILRDAVLKWRDQV